LTTVFEIGVPPQLNKKNIDLALMTYVKAVLVASHFLVGIVTIGQKAMRSSIRVIHVPTLILQVTNFLIELRNY
jgi:hypothetical protein